MIPALRQQVRLHGDDAEDGHGAQEDHPPDIDIFHLLAKLGPL